jgi:CRP-like cAMP-binding protein
LKKFTIFRFIKDEIIADVGDASLGIYFILSGTIGVSLTTETSIKILNYEEGSFFGEIMVLDENFNRRYE